MVSAVITTAAAVVTLGSVAAHGVLFVGNGVLTVVNLTIATGFAAFHLVNLTIKGVEIIFRVAKVPIEMIGWFIARTLFYEAKKELEPLAEGILRRALTEAGEGDELADEGWHIVPRSAGPPRITYIEDDIELREITDPQDLPNSTRIEQEEGELDIQRIAEQVGISSPQEPGYVFLLVPVSGVIATSPVQGRFIPVSPMVIQRGHIYGKEKAF